MNIKAWVVTDWAFTLCPALNWKKMPISMATGIFISLPLAFSTR
jgi:hypothetical protein